MFINFGEQMAVAQRSRIEYFHNLISASRRFCPGSSENSRSQNNQCHTTDRAGRYDVQ